MGVIKSASHEQREHGSMQPSNRQLAPQTNCAILSLTVDLDSRGHNEIKFILETGFSP